MAKGDFTTVLEELDALESELEPMRILVDEGEQTFGRAPTARQSAYHQLEAAVLHTLGSARALIAEVEWEAPEEDLAAIDVLVEEDVLPRRIGADLAEIIEFTSDPGEGDGDPEALYDRMAQGLDTLGEYVEYVHRFLQEWGE